jgi:hypothetical protein
MRHLAQQTFAADPQTVHAARDFAMQALDGWGGCRRGDDIRLCVSELAGNAVQHGSPDGRTYLSASSGTPTACTSKSTTARATPASASRPASPSAEAGRGMRIVQELCDDWGVQALTGQGKAVWVCFRRPEAHASRCSCTP